MPFQAPGINKPTRNAPQEQGTNLKRALKGAGEQIKQNYKDPDAAPFGVGKGPLVRDAKRMNQPSFTRSFGKGPSQVYKQQASSSRPIEVRQNQQWCTCLAAVGSKCTIMVHWQCNAYGSNYDSVACAEHECQR